MNTKKIWPVCAVTIVTLSVLALLGVGIFSLAGGVSLVKESQSVNNGGDAVYYFTSGVGALIFGSVLCLGATVIFSLFLGAALVSKLFKSATEKGSSKQAASGPM